MVKTIISIAAASLLLMSCGHSFTWEKIDVDGHLTGVTAPSASNTDQALGVVKDGVYTAPNGKVFKDGTAPAVAAEVIAVQPRMADLKTVIGHSDNGMSKHFPESELSNWFVDHLMVDVERLTGRHVDVGIANFGGIRTVIYKGDVLKDDIVSMFPFRNYLCYVSLKGEDLQAIFDHFASGHAQVLGGVKFVVKDHKTETLLIGGQPLDPEKTYGVATIDFLLDGGDGLNVAKNAKELIITDTKIMDSMLGYVRELTAAGKTIDYQTDGRVVVK